MYFFHNGNSLTNTEDIHKTRYVRRSIGLPCPPQVTQHLGTPFDPILESSLKSVIVINEGLT